MLTQPTDLRAEFRLAMRRFPAGVTIITSADKDRRHGMTATAITALSLDPPSLLACINRATLLHDIMLSARRFCVNILRRDHAHLSAAFAGSLAPEKRFGIGAWLQTADGIDVLEDAQVNVFCKRVAAIPYGTHAIFIGEVERVRVSSPAEPLIYHDATYCTSVPAGVAA